MRLNPLPLLFFLLVPFTSLQADDSQISFLEERNLRERIAWGLLPLEERIEEVFARKKGTSSDEEEKEIRFVVNIPSIELTVYEGENEAKRYPVAVGALDNKTPTGLHEIQKIVWNPWWYPPKSEWAREFEVTPPGPDSPIGPVKMPLDGTLLIHGTNEESSVGLASSHGCLRMKNDDIRELAWYLQKRLSDKDQDWRYAWYHKNPTRSDWISLKEFVEVEIAYERVLVEGDRLTVLPDLYRREGEVPRALYEQVAGLGIPSDMIDHERIERLHRTRRKISVPIDDLIDVDRPERLATWSLEPDSLQDS